MLSNRNILKSAISLGRLHFCSYRIPQMDKNEHSGSAYGNLKEIFVDWFKKWKRFWSKCVISKRSTLKRTKVILPYIVSYQMFGDFPNRILICTCHLSYLCLEIVVRMFASSRFSRELISRQSQPVETIPTSSIIGKCLKTISHIDPCFLSEIV